MCSHLLYEPKYILITNVNIIGAGYSAGGTDDDVPDNDEQAVGTQRDASLNFDRWLDIGIQWQEEIGASQLGGAPVPTT